MSRSTPSTEAAEVSISNRLRGRRRVHAGLNIPARRFHARVRSIELGASYQTSAIRQQPRSNTPRRNWMYIVRSPDPSKPGPPCQAACSRSTVTRSADRFHTRPISLGPRLAPTRSQPAIRSAHDALVPGKVAPTMMLRVLAPASTRVIRHLSVAPELPLGALWLVGSGSAERRHHAGR